jgi:hypothetical protein
VTVTEPLTNPVTDTLTLLAACLCGEVTPDTCFCGIIPGDQVPAAYAGNCNQKCGMAWVRLVSVYPASGILVPNQSPKNCAAGLGFSVEMGVLRCAHVGTAERPPTSAEQMVDAQMQHADMLAMRRAVYCCPGSNDWILGGYIPTGPQGGLVGGVWTLDMWMP